MRLQDFKALTFDCYGTLIDWESGILAAFGPWRKRTGVAADDDGCWNFSPRRSRAFRPSSRRSSIRTRSPSAFSASAKS